jgi:DnaA-homolog protein
MTHQYPLRLSPSRQPSLDNYLSSGNEEMLQSLLQLLGSPAGAAPLYLWGTPGCGKSHLLLAACRQLSLQSRSAIYVTLANLDKLSPAMLGELHQYELVCIDDVESICARPAWEEALFHLYNAVTQQRHKLLFASASSPGNLPLELADLASRLLWGVSYQLQELDDEAKQLLLMQMAEERGMQLSIASSRYLIRRYTRDINKLEEFIDKIDKDSLARQQKLTIPFLRQSMHAAN